MRSIIVPLYNGAHAVRECLTAIQAARSPEDEIIVVDDASTDGGAAVAAEFPVRLIRSEHRRGAGWARNAGAADASGDRLIFIDADVVIRPQTLAAIDEYLARGEALVCGTYQMPGAVPISLVDGYRLLHDLFIRRPWLGKHINHFLTAIGALRRDVFNELGGFTERYCGAMVEEADFGIRALRAGYKVLLAGDVVGRHVTVSSFADTVSILCRRSYHFARLSIRERVFSHTIIPLDYSFASMFGVGGIVLASAGLAVAPLRLAAVACLAVHLALNVRFYAAAAAWMGWLRLPALALLHLVFSASGAVGATAGVVSTLAGGRRR